jgi:hypothetical protein
MLSGFFPIHSQFVTWSTPWTGDQPVIKPLTAQNNTNTERIQAYIHVSKDIRTHDPSDKAGEDISWLRPRAGRDIAQAVSPRILTAVARVRAQVRSCGICGGQSGTGAGFLRVLRFPLLILIPLTAPDSSSIIRGWYNRPHSGRRTEWTRSHHTSKKLKNKLNRGLSHRHLMTQGLIQYRNWRILTWISNRSKAAWSWQTHKEITTITAAGTDRRTIEWSMILEDQTLTEMSTRNIPGR